MKTFIIDTNICSFELLANNVEDASEICLELLNDSIVVRGITEKTWD